MSAQPFYIALETYIYRTVEQDMIPGLCKHFNSSGQKSVYAVFIPDVRAGEIHMKAAGPAPSTRAACR